MRRFMMLRKEDATGVSGVGYVADGIQFDDGTVCVRWRTQHRSTTVYDSIETAEKIHGHDGKTRLEFIDDEVKGPGVWLCCFCFSEMDPPVNHCLQCGAGGTRVAMDRSQLEMIQKKDDQRCESINKQMKELAALRRVAYDVFGPIMLGVEIDRFPDGKPSGVRLRGGKTVYCDQMVKGDTEETFLARGAERVEFDPDELRRLHKQRRTSS